MDYLHTKTYHVTTETDDERQFPSPNSLAEYVPQWMKELNELAVSMARTHGNQHAVAGTL